MSESRLLREHGLFKRCSQHTHQEQPGRSKEQQRLVSQRKKQSNILVDHLGLITTALCLAVSVLVMSRPAASHAPQLSAQMGGEHLSGVCAEHPIHICPNDDAGALEQGPHYGGTVVAAVALEGGDLARLGLGDEPCGHNNLHIAGLNKDGAGSFPPPLYSLSTRGRTASAGNTCVVLPSHTIIHALSKPV